jgi:alpha-L-fucosidase
MGLSGVALAKPAVNQSAMHTSPQPAVSGRAVTITDARSTTMTMPRNSRSASHSRSRSGNRLQLVEATVVNAGKQWFTPKHPATVSVHAHGVRTVKPARITELAPGEQARVQIGIAKTGSMPDGTAIQGQVVAAVRGGHTAARAVSLHVGIPKFKATAASLAKHQAPNWYNKAKFGIFIHWGVYSVPAWAPVGGNYAEWYWHSMHKKGSPTYKHHKKVYGEQFTYDDFIPRFTAKKFDPRKWVELFKDAGAKYFVLTSMHHEGFSLFDSKQTHRDAVEMGPHQDLVKELFRASRRYTPKLRP